ncbi:hypothetical protein JWR97_26005 [Pseudomonas cedrina subsp. fulgida]|nr:hypothetical protein [Pseudomonas cedrina subsp. fulgida]
MRDGLRYFVGMVNFVLFAALAKFLAVMAARMILRFSAFWRASAMGNSVIFSLSGHIRDGDLLGRELGQSFGE